MGEDTSTTITKTESSQDPASLKPLKEAFRAVV
jgi:hypothetical protein